MPVDQQALMQALQAVQDPNTGRDFVSTKALKNLQVQDGEVSFDVELGYPAKSQMPALRKALVAAARLADRSVRKNIVAGAITFWSLMTALCGVAIGFWTLFLARTGVGVGEGCSGPASQSMIADYFKREELAHTRMVDAADLAIRDKEANARVEAARNPPERSTPGD